ncbi:RNA polymerase sigma factor [Silicimonas sp. MF1-12-2]|uniref:RNA polymerase sigma factor n=1 Tax=Silicimonas sp. MF1-12-2 TaxID=3384793 RepID=UPI0039B624A0
MTHPAPGLADTISAILRDDRGRLLAALIRSLGDFDLAEEALSDATERALVHWGRNGLPTRPDAWLLQVARRAAIDHIRKSKRHAARIPDLTMLMEEDEASRAMEAPEIPDERLRLIFTCCHPALEEKTRVALTLRTVGGLTTREIARAFLDTEVAMGQRLSRAKAKISASGIAYEVPGRQDWDARLNSVLTVLYLIFNEGWTASQGDAPIREALCDEAIWLTRLMTCLAPDEPEIEGLMALMMLSHARRAARFDGDGAFQPLENQDRSLWDTAMIDEGLAILDLAVARRLPGPFQIQAAINALHVRADPPAATDWPQILLLYERLAALAPSPVVHLNRIVALAESGALTRARRELDALACTLDPYQPFHAARAELARRAGDVPAARAAYDRAITLAASAGDRAWLAARRDTLEDTPPSIGLRVSRE